MESGEILAHQARRRSPPCARFTAGALRAM
jgi:hypothetical protein